MAASHPRAGAASVGLDDMAPEPFVLLDLPLSRDYFLDLFREAGVEPVISRRVADPELVRSLVAWGYGYTLANARPAPTRAIDGTPIRAVPLRGGPPPPRIGLARRAGLEPTRSAAAFADACGEVLARSVGCTVTLLAEITAASEDVRSLSGRSAKVMRIAACLAALAPDEVPAAVAFLTGRLLQRQTGAGWASLRDLPPPSAGRDPRRCSRWMRRSRAWRRSPGPARAPSGASSCTPSSPGRQSPSSGCCAASLPASCARARRRA